MRALRFPSFLLSPQVMCEVCHVRDILTLTCEMEGTCDSALSDLSNRPSITEKASKTFMFGGKDSLDITITLPSTAPPIT